MKTITKVRREVMTIANRINKKVKDMAAACRRAWQIVKGRQLISRINGVTYGTRQRALMRLTKYDPRTVNVRLERDAANDNDANAIKVQISVGSGAEYHMGYIPRELAALIAPVMDKGIPITTVWRGVTGGYEYRETYGGLLAINLL